MADRFQELMAGWLEGNLSPAEQAEFISLLEGSDELRSLAAHDRLIDRWLHESRKPPLNADLVMEAIAQRPSELAAKTLAELNRQRFRFDHLAGEVRRLVRRLGAWVQAVRFRPLATAAGV